MIINHVNETTIWNKPLVLTKFAVIIKTNTVKEIWRDGIGGVLFNVYRISVLQDEKSPVHWLHNNVNYLTLLNCALN